MKYHLTSVTQKSKYTVYLKHQPHSTKYRMRKGTFSNEERYVLDRLSSQSIKKTKLLKKLKCNPVSLHCVWPWLLKDPAVPADLSA